MNPRLSMVTERAMKVQAEAEAAWRAAAAAAADLGAWQAAVAERDAELQNLQASPKHPRLDGRRECEIKAKRMLQLGRK